MVRRTDLQITRAEAYVLGLGLGFLLGLSIWALSLLV